MACEYLLLNGAKIDVQDSDGKTPLYLATSLGTYCAQPRKQSWKVQLQVILNFLKHITGHTAQVCLLLKHKANQHLKDSEGTDPLSIAVDAANADIVTL